MVACRISLFERQIRERILPDHTLAVMEDSNQRGILTSIYICPKYPISIPICSNLERPRYISSPDLAWVPGTFQQRLWNKIPHTRNVTGWVMSTEVYKATLGSFCNVREVGIWQWQSRLQYFASTSVSGNISATGSHRLSFSSSAQVFPHFWEGLGADRRAGAEGWARLAVVTCLSPWSVLLLQNVF